MSQILAIIANFGSVVLDVLSELDGILQLFGSSLGNVGKMIISVCSDEVLSAVARTLSLTPEASINILNKMYKLGIISYGTMLELTSRIRARQPLHNVHN